MIFTQIILAMVFVFFIFKTFLKLRRKEILFSEFFGWCALWVAGLILSFKPDTASYFAKVFGIGRGVDLIIYVALIILFYLQFRLMIRLEKINREITRLVREKALSDKE